MPDPPDLLSAIRARPEVEAGWLALAAHYRDNGRDDEAAAVRVFWPAMRDTLATGPTLESVMADVEQHAKNLGRLAREIEERAVNGPSPGSGANVVSGA